KAEDGLIIEYFNVAHDEEVEEILVLPQLAEVDRLPAAWGFDDGLVSGLVSWLVGEGGGHWTSWEIRNWNLEMGNLGVGRLVVSRLHGGWKLGGGIWYGWVVGWFVGWMGVMVYA